MAQKTRSIKGGGVATTLSPFTFAALLTKGDVAARSLEPHSSRFRSAAIDQRLSADVKHRHIAPGKTEPDGALMPISLSLRTLARSSDDRCRLPAEPVFESRLAESRVIAGNECALAQLRAGVARVRVGDNLARILACG